MTARTRAEKWDALSPAYKARLARAGYTRTDYLAGRSRQRARGHANTPEHPSRVRGREEEFEEYLSRASSRGISQDRRTRLYNKVQWWIRLDSSIERYDLNMVRIRIDSMNVPAFILAEGLTLEEWKELSSIHGSALDDWEYTYYDEHGTAINPFWYH